MIHPFDSRSRTGAMGLLVLLATAVSARSSFGPETHLLEARTATGAVVVFLPAGGGEGEERRALVRSPADASDYMGWAERIHPGRTLVPRWDSDPFELFVEDHDLLSLLRAGDEGIDPSGRFRFVVDENPDPAAGKVSLRLDPPIALNDATPECCASNVWLLPRDALFERWGECLEQGDTNGVREAYRALKSSGRFDVPEWRNAANAFASRPGLRAVVRFRNETDVRIRVRAADQTHDLEPAEVWPLHPSPDTESVLWEAHELDERNSSDDDWEPLSRSVPYDSLGRDVGPIDLSGTIGSLKPAPFLAFPTNALPAGVEVRAVLEYEDGVRASDAPIVTRDGRRGVECIPRRVVRRCIVRADGWKDATFTLADGVSPLSRNESAQLGGERMMRDLPPWKDLAIDIDWNGFEGEGFLQVGSSLNPRVIKPSEKHVEFSLSDLLGDVPVSETNISVAWGGEGVGRKKSTVHVRRGVAPETFPVVFPKPVPKVEWPGAERIAAAKKWFSHGNPLETTKSVLYYLKASDAQGVAIDKRSNAKRQLFWLLGFRPNSSWPESDWKDHAKTFDDMVAHMEGCSGCGKHAQGPSPHAVALRTILPDDGKTTVDSLTEWPKDLSGFVKQWWKDCDIALRERNDGWNSADESRRAAKDRWNADGKGKEFPFAEVFVHIVRCSECARCKGFRDMLDERTFEARRVALFRALMSSDDWKWWSPDPGNPRQKPGPGQVRKPTLSEVDRFLDQYLKTVPESTETAK